MQSSNVTAEVNFQEDRLRLTFQVYVDENSEEAAQVLVNLVVQAFDALVQKARAFPHPEHTAAHIRPVIDAAMILRTYLERTFCILPTLCRRVVVEGVD